jgi:hypothetical protein
MFMSRAFKFGVVLAILFAVATVLIAPTIDMPETTLREHSASSHNSGEHAQDGFTIISSAPVNWHEFEMEAHRSSELKIPDRTSVHSTTVLRC